MGSRNTSNKRNNSTPKKTTAAQSLKREPLLAEGMRDDLIGVVLCVLAVVLFVCVIAPGSAVVAAAIETALRHVFGIAAFIIPFAFLVWGISFFVRTQESRLGRFILGVVLILLALMGLFSLLHAQTVPDQPNTLFDDEVLTYGGGFIGSVLAWPLLKGMGQLISAIIFVGVIIAGFVLVGFSIGTVFVFIHNFIHQPRTTDAEDAFEPEVKRGRKKSYSQEDVDEARPESDTTIMLGSKNRRKKRETQDDSFELDDITHDSFDYSDKDVDTAKTVALQSGRKKSPRSRKSDDAKTVKLDGDETNTETVKLSRRPKEIEAAPTALDGFELPSKEFIKVSGSRSRQVATGELKETAALLQETLEEFNLPAKVVGWLAGPTVTLFKVDLPSGVKLSKLTGLADDIALSLAASSVRIAQIPNTSLVGVEIPNKNRATVLFGDILPSAKGGPLELAIGEDIDGNNVCVDLTKMPHLLIGGTTGSGKSVCINGMIMSMLMRATPAEVRMILIDPKRIEFSQYNGIPHLYVPVVTEPKEAAAALRWGVVEMERRLKVFEQVGARNIGLYNQMVQQGKLANEEGEGPKELPYIVIVIDELSDLMMAAGKDVEDSIVRISQLARAAGIHLIVATQRPSSNVVTGMIKANITNRIALLVATGVDSRVIMDQSGAEKLVGNGDMLFSKPEWGKPKRIQGCYVSDDEIFEVVEHLKDQGTPEYHLEILQQKLEGSSGAKGASTAETISDDDPLIWEAADAVVHAGLGSTSMLQRRLKVGYARAGRIMDMLEQKGIVGPQDGSRAREVLIDSVEDLEAIKAFEAADQEGF